MAEMSPLRRRMIEDMTIRNLSPATQRSSVHAVAKFSGYFGRSPEPVGSGGRTRLSGASGLEGVSWAALNPTVCALRLLLGHNNLSSTARYTRVSTKLIAKTASPLEKLKLEVVTPA